MAAPKARNVKAQGNALGKGPEKSQALKARNHTFTDDQFRAFSACHICVIDLGRWPRLLHFAPSALCRNI